MCTTRVLLCLAIIFAVAYFQAVSAGRSHARSHIPHICVVEEIHPMRHNIIIFDCFFGVVW